MVRASTGQRQMHIYQSPFYYIDYCLAQTVSLQIWALMQKDRANAWTTTWPTPARAAAVCLPSC